MADPPISRPGREPGMASLHPSSYNRDDVNGDLCMNLPPGLLFCHAMHRGPMVLQSEKKDRPYSRKSVDSKIAVADPLPLSLLMIL